MIEGKKKGSIMAFEIARDISFSIPEKALLKRIDNRPYRSASSRLLKSIKRAIGDIRKSSNFIALFRITNVDTSNGTIDISNQHFESRKLKSILTPCRKAIVFLTTLGEDIDHLIKEKMKKKPSYGYVLDAVASVAVESGTQRLLDRIEHDFDGETETTLRYSPGYCDWALREQKKLFRILPSDRIGVSLTESFLMSPRKSISGIAGICRKESLLFSGNACLNCAKMDCSCRRESQG
jgi:hypothetical protein